MKYSVTTFKSMAVCIKELERFIRDGNHLETGKPFKKFGDLRSREILSNWLICVAINFEDKTERLRICTDAQGGDGIIYDSTNGMTWHTESILVSRSNEETLDIETLVLSHIEKKQNKGGAAYASGKTLVVFLNKSGGEWSPIRIARKLPHKLDFDGVWAVGLDNSTDGKYSYNVTRLHPNGCPIWRIQINESFDVWEVERIQS